MRLFLAASLVLLPLLSEVYAVSVPRLSFRANQKNNKNNGKNQKGTNANNTQVGAAKGDNNVPAIQKDPQTSLTLDKRVITKNSKSNGLDGTPGESASLTTVNNFINFCLTKPNVPITDGQQLVDGSCCTNPTGFIPSNKKMVSSKFVTPKNGDSLAADKEFTITMAIRNMQLGVFTNAKKSYFAAPQFLNAAGFIVGHCHFVVEAVEFDQITPADPTKFIFFKGIDTAAKNGVVSTQVAKGLPAGSYRLCSLNTAANHQCLTLPVAQRGTENDCVFFDTLGGKGGQKGNGKGNANGGKNSTAAADTTTTTNAAKQTNGGKKKNNGGKNNGGKNNGGKRDFEQ